MLLRTCIIMKNSNIVNSDHKLFNIEVNIIKSRRYQLNQIKLY
jgi:hypothetical protein